MDKVFTKYEKLFRDKTAFEKRMLGIAENESRLQNSKTEIDRYRTLTKVNDVVSNVVVVSEFLNQVREDCFAIRSTLNTKIEKQKLNDRKIQLLHDVMGRLNLLFDQIVQLQSYYPELSDKACKKLSSEFFDDTTPHPPLKKLAKMDYLEVQKFTLDESKIGNPLDRILKMIFLSNENYKITMYSYPLAICLFDFEYLFFQIYAQHINLWMQLYKPVEVVGANNTTRIKLVFINPSITMMWHTKLNLDPIHIENVFEGIKAHFNPKFHDNLKSFLESQPFEGRIQFDGEWLKLLDVFFRLKTFGWIHRHDNDTLFNLIQYKFRFCSKTGQEVKDFTQYHLTEIKRKSNYLKKGDATYPKKRDAIYIKELPYRNEKVNHAVPAHSSQNSKNRN